MHLLHTLETDYFFLNPLGHLGFVPDTFFIVLPFVQTITLNFAELLFACAAGSFLTGAAVSLVLIFSLWLSFILIVGEEKVKFLALSVIQPFFSVTNSLAISLVDPSLESTETLALIGALENP